MTAIYNKMDKMMATNYNIRANDKYKIQLLRDAHVQGEFYECGDVLDVLYDDYKLMLAYKVAVELKEIKQEEVTTKKKK